MAPDPFASEAAAYQGASAPAPAAAALTATERLALSRARMRSFLVEGEGRKRRKATIGDASGLPGIDLLMAKLKEHPVAAAVYDAVTNWWKSHPIHAIGVIAGSAARDAAGPLVRRYPVAMVCGALLVGAVIVRVKPWRLVLKSALFAGLASQVASRLVSAVPLDTVISQLMSFASRKRSAPPSPGESAPPG